MPLHLIASAKKKGRKTSGAYQPPITGLHDITFLWSSVASADDYLLRVGTSTGSTSAFDSTVGNVLTYMLAVPSGTYYGRVLAYQNSTLLDTTQDQAVTV
jgi:hypothetical protein